jgi:hypothetical protein
MDVMVLTISIPPEAEAKLQQRAAEAGEELQSYVARLVAQFAGPPTPLDDISGPIYQRFLESGMTDDELADVLERAKHEMRAERRGRRQAP